MHFVTIYIPQYQKAPRIGATPDGYRQKNIDNFEKALEANSGEVIRGASVHKFGQPDYRGEQTRVLHIPYSVGVTGRAGLANIIASALAEFTLESVLVATGNEAAVFDRDSLEAFATGLEDFGGVE